MVHRLVAPLSAWSLSLALLACATGQASTTEEPEPSSSGGTSSGGTSSGGTSSGGTSSGGTSSGGTSSGGTSSGGTSSGGASSGGTSSGGAGQSGQGGAGQSAAGQSGQGGAGQSAAGSGGAGAPATCAGKLVGGACWYYASSASQSCGAVCQSHGGYHTATRDIAGSGGTDLACLDVLDAVGAPGSDVSALLGSGAGVGCFYSPVLSQRHRVADTATAQNATYEIVGARRVCACNE